MIKLREYQTRLAIEGSAILERRKLLILAMEVRTGKTVTSLEIAKLGSFKNVIFITKKKAISSIEADYDNFGYKTKFNLTVINKESLHKIEGKFDLLIADEFHGFSAYPKPSKFQVDVRERFSHLPMILLSGTPTPESYCQWYHSLQLSNFSPFKEYNNFYSFFKGMQMVLTSFDLGYGLVNNYSNNEEMISKYYSIMRRKYKKGDVQLEEINSLELRAVNQSRKAVNMIKCMIKNNLITYTQEQAGFKTSVNEMILEVEMMPLTYQIIDKIKKDRVAKNKEGQVILCDTSVKLMQKIHQLSSGTCKFEDGTSKVIDYSKVEFIYEKFKDEKIAIFYKFKEELNAMTTFLGEKITTSLEEFNTTDKWIALQIVSGREGISLKFANYLVYYNIDFSAVSYFQSKDRMTTMDRKENTVFYIFAKNGIELKIYKSVVLKKDYTLSTFNKDYARAKNTKENI